MTVVIGKCFGDTIVILSDTMISDAHLGRTDAIPGRLKAITINDHLSIAYAGHSDPALNIARQIPGIYRSSGLIGVLESLRQGTACEGHDVDFIVASHDPGTELRRIWSGQISDSLNETCIGNCAILPEVMSRFTPASDGRTSARNFRLAFINAFTNRRVHLGTGVGGFPIVLQAAPEGHLYKGHTLNESWKPIGPGGTTYEDENDLLTGEWSFRHDLLVPKRAGLAVIGVEVPQGKIGFVYAPLLESDPNRVPLLASDKTWTQYQTRCTP